MNVPFFRSVTGALALASLIAAAGCGGSQPAAPEPSLVAAPPPSTEQPKVRDETTEYVRADVPALQAIHFELDEFQITRDARIVLEDVAVLMKKNPDWSILLEGHCDERGTDEYNLALGENRAQSAKRYLVSLGVGEERFQTVSYGEALPADRGQDESAWASNRRAEFRVRVAP
ncbi:MAG: OmpA family protein [bacterium]